MFSLKLKVYLMEGERKIENFSKEQWSEICIIFQKLVRNLKLEFPDIKIDSYCETDIPYVTMGVEFSEDMDEDQMGYAISYLSGNETDNPVYFPGEEDPCYADSEIIYEDEEDKSVLEKFNEMALDVN